jgi:PAS domain S-box-containing protein
MKTLNLNDIINSTYIGIIAADTNCCITFFNNYAEKYLAIKAKNAVGIHILDILPLAGDIFKKCIETGESKLGKNLPGTSVNIIGNVTPIMKKGRIAGVVCIFLEINEFESSANKLESYKCLNNELEAIFDSSEYGNWLCDGEGTILKLNKAAEKLNGVRAEEVIGKKAWYLVEKGYVDRSCTGEVLKTKRRVKVIQHMKKTNKYIMSTGTPVFDHEGNIFRVVANQFDITGLNTIRKELERSRRVTEKIKDKLSELNMVELNKQQLVVESEKMKQVIRIALKLGHMGASNILILGESGTGKGLLAKFIHKNSTRKDKPFIHINCAALPESLLEAELFGYDKGAFTGASEKGKVGLIELAENGTLFLDEIGDLPLSIQGKLLTYLDDHLVRAVGGVKTKVIECSIIAATNKDLEDLVRQKKFRFDLLYRLNSFTVTIPPLRERPEDVFELANHYLKKYNQEYRMKRRLSSRVIKMLQSYSFPGNVRELSSLFKQAVVMSENDILDDFIITTLGAECNRLNYKYNNNCTLIEKTLNYERDLLKKALNYSNTTREMAKYLGISQSAVVKKLKKHGLPGPSTILN